MTNKRIVITGLGGLCGLGANAGDIWQAMKDGVNGVEPLKNEALSELKAKGIRLIDKESRKGAGGAKIAFIHPKETNGVLVELCERE